MKMQEIRVLVPLSARNDRNSECLLRDLENLIHFVRICGARRLVSPEYWLLILLSMFLIEVFFVRRIRVVALRKARLSAC